jgi:hypothetical protein
MPSPKPKVTEQDAVAAREYFDEFEGLEHLRLRARADLLVIESGPQNDRIPHARLRRLSAQTWRLEMATHTERWQRSPDQGPMRSLLQRLVHVYTWILAPRE